MTSEDSPTGASTDHSPKISQRFIRPPEKLHFYQLYSPDPVPCATVWQGTATRFNPTTPKPFSYQVYITDPSIPLLQPDTPPSCQFQQPYIPAREKVLSFAVGFLEALVNGSRTSEPEQWRLDMWWANGRGPSGDSAWDVEECLAHYRATELERRGKTLHTVPTYFECDRLLGTPFRGVLLIVDGVNHWREKDGIRVVEFDLGVAKEVEGEDGEGRRLSVSYEQHDITDEEAERYEKKWGTTARDCRRSVSIPAASPSYAGGYWEESLGSWLSRVERVGLMRQDYEILTTTSE
ncbi:MAG: hypothetical protein Q9174_003837 [Haloplaca sp. 1 TL-2023]